MGGVVGLAACWGTWPGSGSFPSLLSPYSSSVVVMHKYSGMYPCTPPASALAAEQKNTEPKDAGGTEHESFLWPGVA